MGFVEFFHSGPLFGWVHRTISRQVLGKMDYVVVQSRGEEKIARRLVPKIKVGYLRGPYFTFPRISAVPSASVARKKLGIDPQTNVILFFGFVRPYKGLDYLIEALPRVVKENSRLLLLIAGEFWSGKEKTVEAIRSLGMESHVKIVDTFIPSGDVPLYFASADVCAVPYTAISQSAIIPTSLAYNVPVIATRIGGNEDWVRNEKNGILIPPQDADALASALIHFFGQKKATSMRKEIEKELRETKWTRENEKILEGNF